MIRAILFDLDGTLVDGERDSVTAMVQVVESAFSVTVGRAERDFVIGRSWRAIHERLAAVHPEVTWSYEELVERVVAERARIIARDGAQLLPGARAAIDRFGHLSRALVTGSSRAEAEQMLAALDRAAAFDVVLASEDVARSKPAPDGYLDAARTLGVEPVECAVIEDSEPGIASGLAAGVAAVVAVAAGNAHGHDQSRADRIVSTLDELSDELLTEVARASAVRRAGAD
ncbi:MAG: HAD family phosphatase [Myxococcota bacterium]